MGEQSTLSTVRQLTLAVATVARISALVLVCVASPLALGLYLDRLLGTEPWLLMVGMLVGVVLCVVSVARLVRRQ
ncbi:MAG: AtpZ/AtpI family protein [Calditrichaeota bacterium]|nr:AtpZ/AtpI family protein [Calditrichota bacterium]